MIVTQRWGWMLALILAVGSSAQAVDEDAVASKAAMLLEEIATNPDSGIPAPFLREARGIMVVPHIVDNQFGVGRRTGHGVYFARNEQGEWGSPELVELVGRSVGAEAGHMVTDQVVIYRTQKAADQHAEKPNNKLVIGIGFALTRPQPRFSGPEATTPTKQQTLVYTRRHGIVVSAGVTVNHRIWPAGPTAMPRPSVPADPRSPIVARATPPAANPMPTAPAATPDEARLKQALATLTAPPAPQVAATAPKDLHLSPASTSHAPAPPAESP